MQVLERFYQRCVVSWFYKFYSFILEFNEKLNGCV